MFPSNKGPVVFTYKKVVFTLFLIYSIGLTHFAAIFVRHLFCTRDYLSSTFENVK